jgi:hypothetical protein
MIAWENFDSVILSLFLTFLLLEAPLLSSFAALAYSIGFIIEKLFPIPANGLFLLFGGDLELLYILFYSMEENASKDKF